MARVRQHRHTSCSSNRQLNFGKARLPGLVYRQAHEFNPELNMLRTGLAVYLMLAATLGPWLCCCTVRRLLPTTALSRTADCSAEHKTSGGHRCCEDHAQGNIKEAFSNEDRAALPSEPLLASEDIELPGRCSCQKTAGMLSSQASLGKLSEHDTLRSPMSASIGEELLTSSTLLKSHPLPVTALADASPLPFRSAKDYLHLLHILRC